MERVRHASLIFTSLERRGPRLFGTKSHQENSKRVGTSHYSTLLPLGKKVVHPTRTINESKNRTKLQHVQGVPRKGLMARTLIHLPG